jgi:phosphatidylinositol glycan class U
LSLLLLAFVIQLSLSSIILLLPMLLLLLDAPSSRLASPRPLSSNLRKTFPLLAEFLVYFLVLTLASTLVSGGWGWLEKTWGAG